MNPSWQQGKLREFCKQKGIHVSAWSPLGAYKVFWGSSAVMENPILQEIAEARKKSVAQVLFMITAETIFNDNYELLAKKIFIRSINLSSLQLPIVLIIPLI